jgi:hypothetical protein
MIAGTESFRLAVPDPLNLAAEHHDPDIEIVRMRVTRVAGLLPNVHNIQAFSPRSLERFGRERPAVMATSKDIGAPLGANQLRAHSRRAGGSRQPSTANRWSPVLTRVRRRVGH